MSLHRPSPLFVSVSCAALAFALSANVARAQCRHSAGGGPRSSQMMLQQQMLQQQQLLLFQQQLQRQQLQQMVQLDRQLQEIAKKGPDELKGDLHDPKPEKRTLTAIAVGKYGPPLAGDLIELLTDDNRTVRQAARQALVSLTTRSDTKPIGGRKVDFGPAPDASVAAQKAAARKWQTWIDKQQAKSAKVASSVPPPAR